MRGVVVLRSLAHGPAPTHPCLLRWTLRNLSPPERGVISCFGYILPCHHALLAEIFDSHKPKHRRCGRFVAPGFNPGLDGGAMTNPEAMGLINGWIGVEGFGREPQNTEQGFKNEEEHISVIVIRLFGNRKSGIWISTTSLEFYDVWWYYVLLAHGLTPTHPPTPSLCDREGELRDVFIG